MTFHDEVHRDWETLAHKSAKHLLLWVMTISPADAETSSQVSTALMALARHMEWEITEDDQLGEIIK